MHVLEATVTALGATHAPPGRGFHRLQSVTLRGTSLKNKRMGMTWKPQEEGMVISTESPIFWDWDMAGSIKAPDSMNHLCSCQGLVISLCCTSASCWSPACLCSLPGLLCRSHTGQDSGPSRAISVPSAMVLVFTA
jgi:hypothetical protein